MVTLLFPHTSIWHVLHEQQLHPHHLQKVHALGLDDFAQVHCVQQTTGSPRGTTLIVQPLEVCNTIYTQIFRTYLFPEFSEEKLGCAHYLKKGWYCSASKQNDPVTR